MYNRHCCLRKAGVMKEKRTLLAHIARQWKNKRIYSICTGALFQLFRILKHYFVRDWCRKRYSNKTNTDLGRYQSMRWFLFRIMQRILFCGVVNNNFFGVQQLILSACLNHLVIIYKQQNIELSFCCLWMHSSFNFSFLCMEWNLVNGASSWILLLYYPVIDRNFFETLQVKEWKGVTKKNIYHSSGRNDEDNILSEYCCKL